MLAQYLYRPISTQWVMWLISHQLHLLPGAFPGIDFRLGQLEGPGQSLKIHGRVGIQTHDTGPAHEGA